MLVGSVRVAVEDDSLTAPAEPGPDGGTPSEIEVQFFKQLVQINRTLIVIQKILLVFLIAGIALAPLLAFLLLAVP